MKTAEAAIFNLMHCIS